MRRTAGLFLFSLMVSGLVAACDTKSVVVPPEISIKEESFDGKLGWRAPIVIVLVVDDAATTEAAQLRAQIVENVRSGLRSELEQRWRGSCGNADPAAWHPGDIRVIVARPSAPDSTSLLTPLEIPELAWITKRSTTEEIDIVASATAEALEKRLAYAGELYRPLRAAKRALDLVNGTRPPESDSEAALVASLPPEPLSRLVLASARDDNDVASVGSLAPVAPAFPAPDWDEVVGPFNAVSGTCEADKTSNTRLEAWGDQARAHLRAWPCDAEPALKELLSFSSADCYTPCHAQPLSRTPEGLVSCRVFIDQPDLERCDPERGHRDPGGKPELVDRYGTTLRRCEVNQLTGAALEACRTSLACPDCPSGFCATEVPELSNAQYCEEGEHDWPLRYTGEAKGAPGDWIHVVCTTTTGG